MAHDNPLCAMADAFVDCWLNKRPFETLTIADFDQAEVALNAAVDYVSKGTFGWVCLHRTEDGEGIVIDVRDRTSP